MTQVRCPGSGPLAKRVDLFARATESRRLFRLPCRGRPRYRRRATEIISARDYALLERIFNNLLERDRRRCRRRYRRFDRAGFLSINEAIMLRRVSSENAKGVNGL